MELMLLCSNLPNEIIDIIINLVRLINLSHYFKDCKIDFSRFLYLIKTHNCAFTDDHNFIESSIIVYGEFSENLKSYKWSIQKNYCRHPFESKLHPFLLYGNTSVPEKNMKYVKNII